MAFVFLAVALMMGNGFTLSSPAFRSGAAIPKRFTCDGKDVSTPLRWTAPPKRTRSLALAVVDASTPQRFTHWLAWGISPRSRGLAAGARPPRQGRNDFGRLGYGGPCPPSGATHRYVFTLYALLEPLRLPNGGTPAQFARALRKVREVVIHCRSDSLLRLPLPRPA